MAPGFRVHAGLICELFWAISGDKYENPKNLFTSYFLKFDTGARLELMHSEMEEFEEEGRATTAFGNTHIAVSVDSESKVDQLTKDLDRAGHPVVGSLRRTGDEYYESVVLDPCRFQSN